jgi:RNA polymerase sigma-70 factor (ECF subfamily)
MDLDAAIAELPDGARTIFVLHDVEGFRHEEIAGMLGISAGTSKSQLHRARQSLRALLNRVSETQGTEPPAARMRRR